MTHMKRLRPYLDHGILELDNNTAERTMRAIAIGRKNYLFVGSQTGGKAAATAYTLIETVKLNGIEVMQLRWENVDLSAKTLHLPTTKNGDPLTLPLSEFLADLLAQRRDANQGSSWVFPGPGRTGHLVETKTQPPAKRALAGNPRWVVCSAI